MRVKVEKKKVLVIKGGKVSEEKYKLVGCVKIGAELCLSSFPLQLNKLGAVDLLGKERNCYEISKSINILIFQDSKIIVEQENENE
jgi:hypothetical protein